MIISRTPYRLSFLGGGTDYPMWYRAHGGAVLGTTINKFCYITCRYLPPFFEHRFRVVYSKSESVHTVDEISHPAVREVLRFLQLDRGLEIHHDGDLPARAGMGSSSAFTVGLLHALYALAGRMPSRRQLARESIHIERDRLGESVGSQDQVLAAHGGFNQITFMPDGDFSVEPVPVGRERLEEFHSHLMLFFTGVQRTASHVAASYVNGLDAPKAPLARMYDLVQDGLSLLMGGHALAPIGGLLHEAWEAKRCLGAAVSTPYIDEVYAAARSAGALGGKLLGAGGGGFLLLFADPASLADVRERLHKLPFVPFQFESLGSQVIFLEREAD
jgi:D-glycero-alpha-D-manno-heptose-7-phosphate kinase